MITLEIKGANEIILSIEKMNGALKSFREPLNDSVNYLKPQYDKNFDTAGSTVQSPWAKRKNNYPWPILQKTGKMRKSFKSTVTNSEATISNSASYFKYHQLGTFKLPARIMLKLISPFNAKILKIFNEYLIKKSPNFKP